MELRSVGITVVENNEPLGENIPPVGAPGTEGGFYYGQVWGDVGIDPSKVANHHHSVPKLVVICMGTSTRYIV